MAHLFFCVDFQKYVTDASFFFYSEEDVDVCINT